MVTWIIHQICDGQKLTYHTHGLDEYGSLELELKLMLVPKQAMLFINLIGESIAKGKLYQSGERVEEIFNTPFYLFKTTPIHASHEGELVLRIIFCDPQFLFPWEANCAKEYRAQLSEPEIIKMKELLAAKGSARKGAYLS